MNFFYNIFLHYFFSITHMDEMDLNMDEQCRRAQMLADKKKKGPLVGGKTGTKFDSAKYELSKAKKPSNTEENTQPLS